MFQAMGRFRGKQIIVNGYPWIVAHCCIRRPFFDSGCGWFWYVVVIWFGLFDFTLQRRKGYFHHGRTRLPGYVCDWVAQFPNM